MANPAPILAIAAAKRAQTHCLNDHEFTAENTEYKKDGCRQCIACRRQRQRESYLRVMKVRDGIVDEVALERASRGDGAVYEALTKREHRVLVKQLADRRERGPVEIPFRRLREAVNSELARREKRRGLLD